MVKKILGTEQLSCRISGKVLEEVKIQAIKEKVRLGVLVEKALVEYLERHKIEEEEE